MWQNVLLDQGFDADSIMTLKALAIFVMLFLVIGLVMLYAPNLDD